MQEQAARSVLKDNPAKMADCIELLGDPDLGPSSSFRELWEVVGQEHRTRESSLITALTMLRILPLYFEGDLVIIRIPFGEQAQADDDIEGNQLRLNRLPKGYSGTFWGGKGYHDGQFSWEGKLRVEVPRRNGHVILKPGSVPLEVGTTNGSTTFMHLYQCWGLARWPYHHDFITLLIPLEWAPSEMFVRTKNFLFMEEDHRKPFDHEGLAEARKESALEEIAALEARLAEMKAAL